MQTIYQDAQLNNKMKITSDTNSKLPLDMNMTIRNNYKLYESICLNDEIINYSYEQQVISSKKKKAIDINNVDKLEVNLFFTKCTE